MYTYYVSVWIKYISYLHVNFLTSQPRHLEPQNSRLKLKTITQLRAIHFYLAKNKRNAPRINEKLHKISLSWALLPASFCCSTSLETFWTKLSTNGEVDFKPSTLLPRLLSFDAKCSSLWLAESPPRDRQLLSFPEAAILLTEITKALGTRLR